MTNILLTVLVVLNIVLVLLFYRSMAKVREVYREFQGFIQPSADGQPSPLAMLSQQIADMFGKSVVTLIKTHLMGKASGEARQEKAVMSAVADEAIQQSGSPLAGLYSALPKSLKKNPALVDMAVRLFMNKNGGNGSSTPVAAGSRPKFKL